MSWLFGELTLRRTMPCCFRGELHDTGHVCPTQNYKKGKSTRPRSINQPLMRRKTAGNIIIHPILNSKRMVALIFPTQVQTSYNMQFLCSS